MRYLLFLIFPVFLFSQVNLSGEIKDQTGYPIMGANIIVVNNETQILDGFGISNDNGYFSLNLKKDTEFNIKITFIGYKPIELNISLSDDLVKNFIWASLEKTWGYVLVPHCSSYCDFPSPSEPPYQPKAEEERERSDTVPTST